MNEEKNPSAKKRSGRDRRKLFDVYLLDDQGTYRPADQGNEKRSGTERRAQGEKRVGWHRVSKWGSAPDSIRLLESKTISVSIGRDPREVYEFVSNPMNLPKWASGLGSSIEKIDDEWIASTPQGPAKIRFVDRNHFGVLDHYLTPAPGVEVYVPMRVVPNADGTDLIFTLFRLPGMTDEKFEQDAKLVLTDLMALKNLLETNK
jgi:hypothetical protein